MFEGSHGARAAIGFAAVVIVVTASIGVYTLNAATLQNASSAGLTTNSVGTSSFSQADGSTSTSVTSSYTFRWGLDYMTADPGCSTEHGGGPWVPAPCWGSDAYTFNCLAEAATPQGCAETVQIKGTAGGNYSVVIWYPYVNSSSGIVWENCRFYLLPPAGPGYTYAYCVSVNSTSFLVGQPSPPPP